MFVDLCLFLRDLFQNLFDSFWSVFFPKKKLGVVGSCGWIGVLGRGVSASGSWVFGGWEVFSFQFFFIFLSKLRTKHKN